MLAVQAGARKVFAVPEANAAYVETIIKCNGFEDVISVLHQPVDDIRLPSNIAVDVIIADWVGQRALLSESLVPAVIRGRCSCS